MSKRGDTVSLCVLHKVSPQPLLAFWSTIVEAPELDKLSGLRVYCAARSKKVNILGTRFKAHGLIYWTVMRHDLVPTLQSLLLEQRRFDKEYENPSAAIKVKEMTDVPIILSPDNASRKHRHTTKILYQSKGGRRF